MIHIDAIIDYGSCLLVHMRMMSGKRDPILFGPLANLAPISTSVHTVEATAGHLLVLKPFIAHDGDVGAAHERLTNTVYAVVHVDPFDVDERLAVVGEKRGVVAVRVERFADEVLGR
jgi:hypothetical protein